MIKKNRFISICIFFLLISCKEDSQTKFSYKVSVTAPKEYPVEVHLGYLSSGKDFITTVPKDGIERQGWIAQGSNSGSGGSTIPDFVEITWLSYAEKKFWKLETQLPTDKMLALFREGFTFVDSRNNDEVSHQTYNKIIIGTAPGGVVVIWLDGGLKRVEIGRYQAEEVYVDKLKFQPVKDPNETQQEFFEEGFEIDVPKNIQQKIKKEGIPFGLWDNYREKYNWRFTSSFLKEDKDTYQNIYFFNGEHRVIYEDELIKKSYEHQGLPLKANIYINVYWAETVFNEKEIFDAFKTLSAKHPDKNIEIEVRPAFMYKTTTFTVKCEGEEIPLEKTEVKMWKNAS